MTPRFTAADVERANAEWGCNCGPSAIAAIYGLTLDEVRAHMPNFPGYTSPSLMVSTLNRLGRPWQRVKTSSLSGAAAQMPWWGLCRIQWQGPWTQSGVNPRWAYRHTHWVGAAKRKDNGAIGIWDVNALGNGTGWCSLLDWTNIVAPCLTADIKRATGGWHITHAIEVEQR